MAIVSSNYVQSKEKDILESALITSTVASEETYYAKCVDVTYSPEVVQKFQSREGASATKYLNEAETPDSINPSEGFQKNLSTEEFGNLVEITYAMRVQAGDNTNKMDKIIEDAMFEKINDAYNFVEGKVADLFNSGDDTYLAPDGEYIFASAHTWNSSAATWSNIQTAALPSQGLLRQLETYGGAFSDANGRAMPVDFDQIMVKKGSTASHYWKQILRDMGQYETSTTVGDTGVNVFKGTGMYTLIENPYLDSDTATFFLSSKGATKTGERSLRVNFTDAIHVENPVYEKNGNVSYPVLGSFMFGCVYQPIDMVYNAGA